MKMRKMFTMSRKKMKRKVSLAGAREDVNNMFFPYMMRRQHNKLQDEVLKSSKKSHKGGGRIPALGDLKTH